MVRWVVAAVALIHGLIHLLGAAEAFGWGDVEQLAEPISELAGLWWLLAAALLVSLAFAVVLRWRWWWLLALVAVGVSQVAIFTAWDEARAGTWANAALLLAAGYGAAAHGPWSARAEFRQAALTALADERPGGVVTKRDLSGLPGPVADYLWASGAVGAPRVTSFRTRIHGRIRAGADKPWMRFTGEQVNTYGEETRRLFFIEATMFGLPVDVLHVYADGEATMRVRLCSLVPITSAEGPELTRAETVTLFNDLCVMAPAALVDAPVTWTVLDERRVLGEFRHAGHVVCAELVVDDAGLLVDFVSEDRLRASADGRSFTPQRWSTPLTGYRAFGERRLSSLGAARWHAPEPEGEFDYLEFVIDELTSNPDATVVTTR
jgi:hypothetical protein